MASREARLQQRLRGAQRRQVKDVDFGLVFPADSAPLQRVSSNRRTPQPDGPGAQENNMLGISHSVNDANISAKRRRLNSDAPPSSSQRSTRSSQKIPRPDIYTLNDDEQPEPSVLEASNAANGPTFAETLAEPEMIEGPPSRTARTPSGPARTAKEITENPKDAPGSGHRAHVSISEASTAGSRLRIEPEARSVIETPIPQIQKKRKRGAEASPRLARQVQSCSPVIDELDELSPEQQERQHRRPRKAIEHSAELEKPSLTKEPDKGEEAEAINDEEAAVLLQKNRGRRISRNIPTESPDLNSSEASRVLVTKIQKEKSRPESSPAKQRHPRKQVSKSKSQASRKPRVRVGSPIPVTVHRLTRAPLYDEDELDADILNSEIPRMKRGGVNAIDVLSQICQEIIGAGLDTLEDGCNNCEDPALRLEYRTKLRAVEAFGNELQTRLLEHTINLDNLFSLERRLRDEQKKKLGLREDILRIRAEREQVALRMDEVRIRHENETKRAQERDALNTTVHDIELAVDLGKTSRANNGSEMTGTEVLLKRLADEVSNNSDSGGILKHIKEFNAFLERAALVLESRKN